jgi:nucleolar protein 14
MQVSLMKSITLPAGPASGTPDPSAAQGDDGFKLGLLRIALHAAARSAELCSEHPDAYDLTTRGLRSALSALGAHKGIELPPELELLRKDVLGKMVKTAEASLSARVPLARKAPSGGASAAAAAVRREFNPRFEEGYTKGRDYDPDRERAEQRKLKRQVGKEKRGEEVGRG